MSSNLDDFYAAALNSLENKDSEVPTQRTSENVVEEVREKEMTECYCPTCPQTSCVMRGSNNAFLFSEIFEDNAIETLLQWAKLGVLEKRLRNADDRKKVIMPVKPIKFESGGD